MRGIVVDHEIREVIYNHNIGNMCTFCLFRIPQAQYGNLIISDSFQPFTEGKLLFPVITKLFCSIVLIVNLWLVNPIGPNLGDAFSTFKCFLWLLKFMNEVCSAFMK